MLTSFHKKLLVWAVVVIAAFYIVTGVINYIHVWTFRPPEPPMEYQQAAQQRAEEEKGNVVLKKLASCPPKEPMAFCVLEGHIASIVDLAVSPDGRLLASMANKPDNTIKIWDLVQGKQVGLLKVRNIDPNDRYESPAFCEGNIWIRCKRPMAFSPDGRFLAFLPSHSLWPKPFAVALWDIEKNKEAQFFIGVRRDCLQQERYTRECLVETMQVNRENGFSFLDACGDEANPYAIAFHPSGRFVAVACFRQEENSIHILQLPLGQIVRTVSDVGIVGDLFFSADIKFLTAAMLSGEIKTWDVSEITVVTYAQVRLAKTVRLLGDASQEQLLHSVTFSPDGQQVAFAWRGQLRVSYAATGEPITTLGDYDRWGRIVEDTPIAFSFDNRLVASSSSLPRVWEVATGQLVYRVQNNLMNSSYAISGGGPLLFTPDGKFLVLGQYGGDIVVWNIGR